MAQPHLIAAPGMPAPGAEMLRNQKENAGDNKGNAQEAAAEKGIHIRHQRHKKRRQRGQEKQPQGLGFKGVFQNAPPILPENHDNGNQRTRMQQHGKQQHFAALPGKAHQMLR